MRQEVKRLLSPMRKANGDEARTHGVVKSSVLPELNLFITSEPSILTS